MFDIEYENSEYKGIYSGQINENGHPHGLGRLISPFGWMYEGHFQNGIQNGHGRYLSEYFYMF